MSGYYEEVSTDQEGFTNAANRLYWLGKKPCEIEYNGGVVTIYPLGPRYVKRLKKVRMLRGAAPADPVTGKAARRGRPYLHFEQVYELDKSLPDNERNWVDLSQDAYNHLLTAEKLELAVEQNDGEYVEINGELFPPLVPGYLLEKLVKKDIDVKQSALMRQYVEVSREKEQVERERKSAEVAMEEARALRAKAEAERASIELEMEKIRSEKMRLERDLEALHAQMKPATESGKPAKKG